eukprot:scaffold9371_cov66-Cyclotella_meneghiniana.AAC.12
MRECTFGAIIKHSTHSTPVSLFTVLLHPIEEAVANSCAIVNPHYTYTANIDSYSDEEDSDSDSMMEPTD